MGTYAYCAPEILDSNHRELDGKVDSWSMGVMAYVMLAGAFPFDDKCDKGMSKEERYS